MTLIGFPHSEILGLSAVCAYPRLIAACHVLHLLPAPRHPPCALNILTHCTISTLFSFTMQFSRCPAPRRTQKKGLSPESWILCLSARKPRETKSDRPLVLGRGAQALYPCHQIRGPGTDLLPRKEVIQPHLPVRLPCYDFTPLTLHTFGASLLLRG